MNKLKPNFTAIVRRLITLLCLTLCLIAGTSCRSTDKPASASFASVVISGNTPGQIRDAAIDVFRADGYKIAQNDPGRLVFEKEGSGMNNFAYGNWLGDTSVWIRVKARIVPVGEMTFRLECTAGMVRDIGGATEEELALSGIRKGHYQKLLDDVANHFTRK